MLSQKDVMGVHDYFAASATKFPASIALETAEDTLTYAELSAEARSIAGMLKPSVGLTGPCLIGVYGSRTAQVYASLLGILMAGHGIVPLNPALPPSRTQEMMHLSGLSALVVDDVGISSVSTVLESFEHPISIFSLAEKSNDLAIDDKHTLCSVKESESGVDLELTAVSGEHTAYLFFTSGTTGKPKAIQVLHSNLCAYIDMTLHQYESLQLGPGDRFSQFYDITFDSSLFDIFFSWALGASLCCPTTSDLINPNRFIEEKRLKVIDIVPSMARSMIRRGGWADGRFEELKLCRFGGEAMTKDLAYGILRAAPNVVVDNAYGPTEGTVDACIYRWSEQRSDSECYNDVVPIGYPGHGIDVKIVDEALQEVPAGEEGELIISGPQITPGYWRDAKKTERAFVKVGHKRYYRTGDLVTRTSEQAPIVFLGRLDEQVKIGGVRVELTEIEHAVCDLSAADQAVAVGAFSTHNTAKEIVVFLRDLDMDSSDLMRALSRRLPRYMLPTKILSVEEFPKNANGKIDRKALLENLEAGKYA